MCIRRESGNCAICYHATSMETGTDVAAQVGEFQIFRVQIYCISRFTRCDFIQSADQIDRRASNFDNWPIFAHIFRDGVRTNELERKKHHISHAIDHSAIYLQHWKHIYFKF